MVIYTAFFTEPGGSETMFYASNAPADTFALVSGVVHPAVNGAGTFDFVLPTTNSLSAKLTRDSFRKIRMDVYRRKDGGENKCLFSGYPTSISVDDINQVTVNCNGLLAVMNDIVLPPFSFPVRSVDEDGAPLKYLIWLFQKINASAFHTGPSYTNIFNLGLVRYPTSIAPINRTFDSPTTAWAAVKDFLETCGGYLVPHYSAGSVTVDWLNEATETSAQNIEQAVNLVSIETELDTTDYYSGIYAVGDEIDDTPVTLPWTDTATSRSGGYLFRGAFYRSQNDIQQQARVAIVKYDGVTNQNTLLTHAAADLASHATVKRITKVTAADLGYITEVAPFELFQKVSIVSPAHSHTHDLTGTFIITELDIDVCNPENCQVVVDTQTPTLTSMSGGGGTGSSTAPRAYYQSGDSLSQFTYWTGGFVTESKTNIRFTVPLLKPVVADSVEVELALQLRQDGKYTHGSGSNTRATPSSVTAVLTPAGIRINAVMSDTTNAINNAPVGIAAYLSVTFK